MARTSEKIKKMAEWAEKNNCPQMSEVLPFIPREGFSASQRKILAAMSVPKVAGLTVAQQAAYAGVSRKTWFRQMQKPEFRAAVKSFFRQYIGNRIPGLLHRYVRLAFSGDRQALERLLEQTGILDPLKSTKENGNGDTHYHQHFNLNGLSDEQRNRIRDGIASHYRRF